MTIGMLKYVLIILLFYSVSFEDKHVSLVTHCSPDQAGVMGSLCRREGLA